MSRNKCRQAVPVLLGLVTLLLVLQTNMFGLLNSDSATISNNRRHASFKTHSVSGKHAPSYDAVGLDDIHYTDSEQTEMKLKKPAANAQDDQLPLALRKPQVPLPGHMGVQRKDLDLSGDPSASMTSSNDTQLLAYLIRKTGRDKSQAIESIIRVAHALEASRTHPDSRQAPPSSTGQDARVNPQRPPRKHAPFDAPSSASTGKAEPSPVSRPRVSEEVYRKLSSIVHSMKSAHDNKPRVTNTRLDIYESDDASESSLPAWQRFHNQVSQHALYDPKEPVMKEIIDDLTKQPIDSLYQHKGGTQLKLVFSFQDRSRVLFKPRRFDRNQETLPDHYYFSDYERFNAEIASYHLDRILEFYRVPPTVGRVINMTSEILNFANKKLASTFFVSPAGNLCFYGHCSYYCDTNHAICGQPDLLEGSMAAFLPSSLKAERIHWTHPWRRSYNKHHLAAWRTDPEYCDTVRETPPFDSGRRLLDLSDLSVFDFFTGNLDRHHYETFEGFGNFTFVMALDNGRSFGHSDNDDLSILAPLAQCCLVRYSTLVKLLNIHRSPNSLAERMRKSMSKDKVAPVLTERQLRALDRRLKIILQTVYDCLTILPAKEVIVDDGF